MNVRVLIFGDLYRAGRTARALSRAGLVGEDVCGLGPTALAGCLTAAGESVWLVRAGAWPVRVGAVHFPPPSATGLPLCALGAVRAEVGAVASPENDAHAWEALHAQTGGDFSQSSGGPVRLPPVASLYLEADPAARLAEQMGRGEELLPALQALLGAERLRVVHYPALDVHDDPGLRVVQVVTSLQRGGAERVALDLAGELPRCGVRCRVVTLGRPTRASFPAPPGTIDLSHLGGDRASRAGAVADSALDFAADLVHGHLLHREDAAALSARGLPLLLTVHNMRPGWPTDLDRLRVGDAVLLAACARAVEADLRSAGIPVPVRTAWNGIDFSALARTPALLARAREFRRRLGIRPDDFVLLALANPRPQKRLHLLPAVLAGTRAEFARRGIAREARLLLAGEASCCSEAANRSVEEVRAEVQRLGLGGRVHWLGPVADVAPVLVAADILVSASAYEGLSLAHLEALAAGLPVVATDVGGTAEAARDNPAVALVPPDAGPELFAAAVADFAKRSPEGRTEAAVHFTRARMAERYRYLYPRAIAGARGRRPGDGLVLVINNFSTGGAQSSARRLLTGLAAEGVRVRAAVLEEQVEYPTPGRRALAAAGVPVLALPPAGTTDPAEGVRVLLGHIDADPPQAVLFWNALAQSKVLLADALLDIPVYDVSPGEMYFTSLDRYFARPRPGLPYRTPGEYGARLAGVIVKYAAEAGRAAATLGAPVHVIPNGVPVGHDPPPRPAGGPLVIGTLARISPQKKLEDLLAALRSAQGRLPPHVLRISGGVERGCEEYANGLRRLADGLPVEWVGEVDDPTPFLRGLGVFALVAEPAGCPNASLEAMAAGLAVVATDVGGIAEQVEDGVTGRLVPRGDVEGLADALGQMAMDSETRARFGAAGRERVADRFSLRRMLDGYRRVCLAGGHPSALCDLARSITSRSKAMG